MRRLAVLVVAVSCRARFDPIDADAGAGIDADGGVPGLVARYTCDELAAGVLPDASGHGHDGTCTTCPDVVTPGKVGAGACRFFATGERVTIAPFAMSSYSVAAWLLVDALPAMTVCPVNRPFGPTIQNSWQLCVDGADLVYYTTALSSPNAVAIGAVAPSTWVHTIIQWDGQTKALLVNGAVKASTPADDLFDSSSIFLGEDVDSGAPVARYSGYLDDIRIYDRVLTADEIDALQSGS